MILDPNTEPYIKAFEKCDLRTSVMPFYRGYIVEDIDTYNKIQRLLDTPEMESSHQFLYSLDVEALSEKDVSKVNKLYEKAVERGCIEDDDDDLDECDVCGDDSCDDPASHLAPDVPVEKPELARPAVQPVQKSVPQSAYTVMYSAMKDGEIKCGECYSNSLNTRSAKADAIAKLERLGFTNISIMAIEAGDPDMMGAQDNEIAHSAPEITPDDLQTKTSSDEYVPAFEDDEEKQVKEGAYSATMDQAEMKKNTKNKLTELFDKISKQVNAEISDDDRLKVKKFLSDNDEAIKGVIKYFESSRKELEQMFDFLKMVAAGKITEPEGNVNEGKKSKKSTGLWLIVKGLIKLFLFLISVVGDGANLSGKFISWLSKLIKTGADKLNAYIGESEYTVQEASDDDSEDADDSGKDSDEDTSDDADSDDAEDSGEDSEDSDEEASDDADSGEENKEDADKDDKEDKELDDATKATLKDAYKKAFKATMLKCKFEKAFNDLTLEEKIKFFTELSKAWKKDEDPSMFMTAKEIDVLNKMEMKR